MDQKIQNYIKTEKEKGFKEHQIRSALIHAGYPEHIVDENLHFSKPYGWIYAVIGVLILIILISAFFFYFGKDQIMEANQLLRDEKYIEAKAIYISILEEEPDNVDALFGLALTHVDLQEYEEAIQTAQKMPDSMASKDILLGRVYYKIDDYTNANVSFTDSKLSVPKLAGSYIGLALISYRQQKFEQAIHHLQEGQTMSDDDCLSIYILGIYSEQNNQEHDYFEQAQSMNCPLRREFNS